MFKRLAKSGLAKFGLVQPQRIAPGLNEVGLSNRPCSNDNLPKFRRPAVAGRRRSPTAALACHWFDRNGRLECRWHAEPNGDTLIGDFDGHDTIGKASALSSMPQPRAGRISQGIGMEYRDGSPSGNNRDVLHARH
jgi:hypothetical protein